MVKVSVTVLVFFWKSSGFWPDMFTFPRIVKVFAFVSVCLVNRTVLIKIEQANPSAFGVGIRAGRVSVDKGFPDINIFSVVPVVISTLCIGKDIVVINDVVESRL